MLTGDNGILTQAGKAKEATATAQIDEAVNLAVAGALTSESYGDITDESIKAALAQNMPAGTQYTVTEAGTSGWTVKVPSIGKTYGISSNGTIEELSEIAKLKQSGEPVTKKTTIVDDDGDKMTLPEEFAIKSDSPTTIKDGVVVIDTVGNEFVWVPVPNAILDLSNNVTALSTEAKIKAAVQAEIDAGRYPMAIKTAETDTNGRAKYFGVLYGFTTSGSTTTISPYSNWTPLCETNYREPAYLSDPTHGDASTTSKRGVYLLQNILGFTETGTELKTAWTNQMQNEFDEMVEKVAVAKGYYVGRYEMSGSATNAQSKPNVTALKASTAYDSTYSYTWYGLYKAGKNYTGNSKVASSMIWGSQYDQMLIWMVQNGLGANVTSTTVPNGGTYNSSSTTTAPAGDTDIINNVYDLYGGRWEWILEATNIYFRVRRGGHYFYNGTPNYRYYVYPYNTDSGDGSRLTLYIK